MFKTNLYKNHYPLTTKYELCELNEKENAQLAKLLRCLNGETRALNIERAMRSVKYGAEDYVHVQKNGGKTVLELAGLVSSKQYCDLTQEDIGFVSAVIYAYKYGWLSRLWYGIFPNPMRVNKVLQKTANA